MNKQEILAAIEKGIAGQGTNVDGGGYLPKILSAIVELIPDAPDVLEIVIPQTREGVTRLLAAGELRVSLEEFNSLPEQKELFALVDGIRLTRVFSERRETGFTAIFGMSEQNTGEGHVLSVFGDNDSWTVEYD